MAYSLEKRSPSSRLKALCAVVTAVIGAVATLVVSGGWDRLQGLWQDPLIVEATFGDSDPCGGHVIPLPVQELPPLTAEQWDMSAGEWSEPLGGVIADTSYVAVQVFGRGPDAVVLNDLKIGVVERAKPLTGTYISSACGEAVSVRYMSVDLDDPKLEIEAGDTRQNTMDVPVDPIRFPYKVSASEPEVFSIVASTASCLCSWVADLEWSAGGERGSVRIDDHGKPFTVTTSRGVPAYTFNFSETGALVPRDLGHG